MAPSAGALPPDDRTDRSLLAKKSGSSILVGSEKTLPADSETLAADSETLAAAARLPDETSSEVNPSAAADSHTPNPNPNPNPNGAKGKDTPRGEQPAPRTYATIAADKARRPPPAFVMNLTAFHPVKRGTAIVLKMPEELYQKRLSAFTHALIGRIYLPKSSPPRALPDLKSELRTLFKTSHDWILNPLGKGFFSLKFSSQEDQFLASRFTTWRLKIGSFHIREWKPNFDPYKEQNSITQIWVRLFHLPEEYWDAEFLVGIFRAVGNVVKLDGSTAAGTVGHFARALVEVDLNYPLADSVTIECGGSSFLVDFGFENVPLFCSHCRYIGHLVSDCKSRKREEDTKIAGKQNAEHVDKPVEAAPKQKAHNPHDKKNARQLQQAAPATPVLTSNAFAALENDASSDPHADVIRELVPQTAEAAAAPHAEGANDTPDSGDPPADANSVRALVPLSAEAAAALHSIAGRDYTLHNPETENVLTSDDEEVDEIQADNPTAVVDSQPDTTTSELPFNAEGLELEATRTLPSPKESAIPLETTPTDKDETTMVVPPPAQVADNKMSAAAKRRTKEALRKTRVKSSMKTRSSFDISSDKLHVLADKRGKSAQVPADSVGQPYGPHPKQSHLEDKLRTAVEQGKRPTAYVLDTGQSGALKAMEFIAKQRWGDVLDIAKSDNDIYDLTS